MAAQKRLLLPTFPSEQATERSKKLMLRKDILLWFRRKSLGWTSDIVETTGQTFTLALTDCLWYIDGHTSCMESRSCKIPSEFEQFNGYNNPEKSKHRKREIGNMCASTLDSHSHHSHSALLNKFAIQPWFDTPSWKPLKQAVCSLADVVAKYALYLKEKNIEVQGNHSKSTPVRSVSESESFCFVQKSMWVKPTHVAMFKTFQNSLDSMLSFEPLLLNDLAPGDPR